MNEYTIEEIAMEEKLKRCPFCGQKAAIYRSLSYGKEHDYVFVQCANEGCAVRPRTEYMPCAEYACNEWNNRPAPTSWETVNAARLWALQNCLQAVEKDLETERKPHTKVLGDPTTPEKCKQLAHMALLYIDGFKQNCDTMLDIVSGNDIPAPPDLERLYELIRKLVGAARWGLENVQHARCLRETELTRPDMKEQQNKLFGKLSDSFSKTIEEAQKILDRHNLRYYENTRLSIDEMLKRNFNLKEIEKTVFDHISKPFDPPIYTHGCEILDSNHNVIAVCKTDPDKHIVGPETAEAMAAAMNRYATLLCMDETFNDRRRELRRCKCGNMPVFGLTVIGFKKTDRSRGEVAVNCPVCGRTTELCNGPDAAIDYWNRLFAMDKKKAKEMYGDDDQEMGGQGLQRPVPDAAQK